MSSTRKGRTVLPVINSVQTSLQTSATCYAFGVSLQDAMRVTVRKLYSTAVNIPVGKTVRSSFPIADMRFLNNGLGDTII